jgi:hypothetical protein
VHGKLARVRCGEIVAIVFVAGAEPRFAKLEMRKTDLLVVGAGLRLQHPGFEAQHACAVD